MRNINKFHQIKYTSNQIKNNLPVNFCAAPFTQMFLYPTGDAYVCCEGGGHLGNIKNNSLEELWNGEKAQTLRKEFLDGKPMQCKKNIDCKGCNKNYNEFLIDGDLEVVQKGPPQNLDLIINGKCNIDCIMCEVKTEVRSLLDIDAFHTEIVQKVLPTVKIIAVKSGEPFVQKETYWLIDKLAELKSDAKIRFTTNGQYVFNDKIKSSLNKINLDRITFSIDSIYKDTFEKIRKDGSLTKLLKVIDDVKTWISTEKDKTQIELSANITLQKDNWREVPETLKSLYEQKLVPHIIIVEKPEAFSLQTLSDQEFFEVCLFYFNLPTEYEKYLAKLYVPIIALAKLRASMQFEKISIMLKKRLNESFHFNKVCSLPFTQMSIFPNGKLRPCCWLNKYDLRQEKDGNFNLAWNDEPIKKIRKQFIEDKPTICSSLIKKTSCNQRNHLPADFYDLSLEIDRPPQKLHWYFSGSCNLECPSCRNWQFKDEFDESDVYWKNLVTDIFPHLCEIEVVGGEPFYQKRTFQLIDTMVDINPDCLWYITSNGQFNFEGKIKDSISKIRIAYFSVSIDSLIAEKFNRIRKNGVLDKTVKFLDDLIAYREKLEIKRKFKITVNFVLQKDNYDELEEMLKFTLARDIRLYIIPLVGPVKLSIYDLPSSTKIEILEKIKKLSIVYKSTALNLDDVVNDLKLHISTNQKPRPELQIE